MKLSHKELEDVLKNSECLINKHQIEEAYNHLATQLNFHYQELNPIVLVVMNGGLIPAGQLLTRFTFFHRIDYIHASRYENNLGTDGLNWKAKPKHSLNGEHILLIDDIFDEGITIKSVVDELLSHEPASLKSAVLLNKKHDRKVQGYVPDFIGCEVEDRYIFGCGMDYHGYLRHLSGIYALKEEK